MFSVESRLNDIYKAKQFNEFKDYLSPDMGLRNAFYRRKEIKSLTEAWPKKSIADAFNCMVQLREAGEQLFYPLGSNRQSGA